MTQKDFDQFIWKKGFVDHFIDEEVIWVKRFVGVKLIDEQLYMGHKIEQTVGELYLIELEDFTLWFNYFDNI